MSNQPYKAKPLCGLLGLTAPGVETNLPVISGIADDSRAVKPGFLFAAIPGLSTDGRDFIAQAIKAGAVAILTLDAPHPQLEGLDIPVIRSPEPRRALAEIAGRFFGPMPATLMGVTGTNGKTSVADFVRQIWHQMGVPAASIGTLGAIRGGGAAPVGGATHTTASPIQLHQMLADLKADGFDHVVLEASSHGIHQHRLHGCRFKVAGFTNLTRDHMDYHKTEFAYLAAKGRLFSDLLAPGGHAVVYGSGEKADYMVDLAKGQGHSSLRVGFDFDFDWRISQLAHREDGQRASIEMNGRQKSIFLPLIGEFQLLNWMVAAAMVVADGADPNDVFETANSMKGVPGRMESVGFTRSGAAVLVDYAHTPDGLETILAAARPFARGRLVVLFGCGGNRDRGKRQEMGAVATRLADRVVVTDDNPRHENPAVIRAAIMETAPNAQEIGDRGEAIEKAISDLRDGDLLLVAGKGHEVGQQVGSDVLPFSDVEHVAAALKKMGGRLADEKTDGGGHDPL